MEVSISNPNSFKKNTSCLYNFYLCTTITFAISFTDVFSVPLVLRRFLKLIFATRCNNQSIIHLIHRFTNKPYMRNMRVFPMVRFLAILIFYNVLYNWSTVNNKIGLGCFVTQIFYKIIQHVGGQTGILLGIFKIHDMTTQSVLPKKLLWRGMANFLWTLKVVLSLIKLIILRLKNNVLSIIWIEYSCKDLSLIHWSRKL